MLSRFLHVQDDDVRQMVTRVGLAFGPPGVSRFLLRWAVATRSTAMKNAMAKGGRRLWRAIARSVEVREQTLDGVSVSATHPAAAQKQFGGVIEAPGKGPWAKGAGALTIPIPGTRAEGRMAGEFGELVLIQRSGGKAPLLVKPAKGRADFEPLFVLVKRTRRQSADPWWPSQEETNQTGLLLAGRMLEGVS